MAKAWVSQDAKQLKRVGKRKASWYANWYEPGGRRRSKSFGSGSKAKQDAFRFCKNVERDIVTGDYGNNKSMKWADFVEKYKSVILTSKSASNRRLLLECIKKYESRLKPGYITDVTTMSIDTYISKRLTDRGAKRGSKISPCTINKELRSLKSVIRIADDWDLITKVPKFHFLDEPVKYPRFVTIEHFGDIFEACITMDAPQLPGVSPTEWWRGLLTTCFLTGWRISEVLQIHQSDLNFETGILSARYQNEKRSRDDRVRVPDTLLGILKPIWDANEYPMNWPKNSRSLYLAFNKLQQTAGIHLPCNEDHEHTKYCHTYGFHDLRRGFATMNAGNVSESELQRLMKHRCFETTKRYINMANMADRLQSLPSKVYIPDILKPSSN